MKKINKKLFEKLILLILIITLIITIIITLSVTLLNKTPLSNNEPDNYQEEKNYSYNIDLSYITTYQIPFIDEVDKEKSYYKLNVLGIDNTISKINEEIKIKYNYINSNEKDQLKSFCNSFNEIKTDYEFLCIYKDDEILINTEFIIKRLNSSIIKTPKKEIDLGINKNTQLTEYILSLQNKLLIEKDN